jgi:murein DD-endopeptidase MepM/ murein hydrolase activator NlpD
MSENEGKPRSSRLFTIISWGVTAVIVASLLGFTFWKTSNAANAAPMPEPIPTAEATPEQGAISLPVPSTSGIRYGIQRRAQLKTSIPGRPRYDPVEYTVVRGDALFRIASEYKIKPETLLWANYDVLEDDPHSLKPGQVLNIPPIDGLLYEWQEGDTLESVAAEYKAEADDILSWPGNALDLTRPEFEPGQLVMIPGGYRESKAITLPTIARGSGTGTANPGGSTCGGGAVGSGGFIWPADNHFISGNDYFPGHLGIDIAAGEGSAVYASDSGVVTMASSGWNYGYGNVIQIDHGNGYSTLYAHLSQINVTVCQSVFAGQLIGLSGNTGNSFGAHLHFEVRQGGGNINPWYVLP